MKTTAKVERIANQLIELLYNNIENDYCSVDAIHIALTLALKLRNEVLLHKSSFWIIKHFESAAEEILVAKYSNSIDILLNAISEFKTEEAYRANEIVKANIEVLKAAILANKSL